MMEPNPWERIALSDYEGHMSLESVRQLQTMNRLMGDQLTCWPVSSAMVLGVAGGNGLEHVTKSSLKKVYGVDVNAEYLEAARTRYSYLGETLECIQIDLTKELEQLPTAELLIANLLIEYVGYECFQSAVKQVRPQYVSCALQMDMENAWVSASPYTHVFAELDQVHHSIDKELLTRAMESIGYTPCSCTDHILSNNKKLVRIDFQAQGSGRSFE